LSGGLSFGFLVLWEWLQTKDGFSWLREEWIRPILVGAVLIWLSAILWRWIFDFGYCWSGTYASEWIGLVVWAGAIAGGIYFYTKQQPSILCMSFCVLAAAVILVFALGRVLLEDSWSEPGGWLIAAILTIGIFGGATAVILRFAKMVSGETNPQMKEVA